MEKKILPKGSKNQDGSHNYCEMFDKLSFPMGAFNPPQKDEFEKRMRCKKCRECPFFGWITQGPQGRPGRDGKDGKKGDTGTFNASSLFLWKTDQQTLAPASTAGTQGDAISFTDFDNHGTALSFTSPTKINILESGRYLIRWEVYTTMYDSAFALFSNAGVAGVYMLPGSNYGALSHNEKYSGQTMATLTEGGILTLNRIDTMHSLKILNQISGGVSAIGASVTIIKIA